MLSCFYDFISKKIKWKNKNIQLQIWDTSGQERFDLGKAFFQDTDSCILVYDITNSESFQHLEKWNNRIKDKNIPIVVIGNKIDIRWKRQVLTSDAISWCKNVNYPFWETSAVENFNVHHPFTYILQILEPEPEIEQESGDSEDWMIDYRVENDGTEWGQADDESWYYREAGQSEWVEWSD